MKQFKEDKSSQNNDTKILQNSPKDPYFCRIFICSSTVLLLHKRFSKRRRKQYTFFKTLVSKTMSLSIKFLWYKMIQSNHLVTLLILQHFTKVLKFCNLHIFVRLNIAARKLASFHLFLGCFVILSSEESILSVFFFFLQLRISSVLHLLLVYLVASYS